MNDESKINNTPEQNKKNNSTMYKAIYKNSFILGLFALLSTGLIALTHLVTKDKITQEIERSLIKRLSEIVPPENYSNNVYYDCIIINDINYLGSNNDQKIYRMRNTTENHALMMTTIAPDGYSGNIDIAIVISTHGKIIGVNIIDHKETPGLGDKIERKKSDWLNQFNQLSLSQLKSNQWRVKKDGGKFDALTGATITPRAVIKAVHKGLIYLSKNHQKNFEQASNCYASPTNGN